MAEVELPRNPAEAMRTMLVARYWDRHGHEYLAQARSVLAAIREDAVARQERADWAAEVAALAEEG